MKKYSTSHEWALLENDQTAMIGISHHAQTLLGDIAFLELPAVGAEFKQGEAIGVIESVKSASDFYTPLSGRVLAVNIAAAQEPAALNGVAESTWLVQLQLSDPREWEGLMSDAAYHAALEKEHAC